MNTIKHISSLKVAELHANNKINWKDNVVRSLGLDRTWGKRIKEKETMLFTWSINNMKWYLCGTIDTMNANKDSRP